MALRPTLLGLLCIVALGAQQHQLHDFFHIFGHGSSHSTLAPPPPGIARAIILNARREWPRKTGGNVLNLPRSTAINITESCTDSMRHYGLCDDALLTLPPPRDALSQRPFVFLHFSKCAGTSLISHLSYLGYLYFSLFLPRTVTSRSAAGCESVAAKCCWWRERLSNLSASGRRPRLFVQEPGNEAPTVTDSGVLEIEPTFEASRDFCDDLSYLTVMRPPVERMHSHMCERGIGFREWQETKPGPLSVRMQIRDNYYVRSLGGPDAWNAQEGGLTRRHLHAAAKTLARFDVVMTVANIARDARAQMGRIGLPGFRWPRVYSRSRADNLNRAKDEPRLRTAGLASCEVPPTAAQLSRLVAACSWDAALYDFARVLADRRTEAYASPSEGQRAMPLPRRATDRDPNMCSRRSCFV